MAAFAVAKEPFLRSFLKLEHGLPEPRKMYVQPSGFVGSTPSSSAIASSASWAGLPMPARAWSRLMAVSVRRHQLTGVATRMGWFSACRDNG